MQLDYYDLGRFPGEGGSVAAAAERVGFGGCWFAEVGHNPFVSAAIASQTTSRLTLGTAVALAFPRSPMVTAQAAWDLSQASGGRFVLGLGTQVKRHIEQRFSVQYSHPVARMREYVGALRAIFDAFQTGGGLHFAGDFYRFSYLPAAFSPGPIDDFEIPVYLAGVNGAMARLAGEIADGFVAHPLHSVRYLREVIAPAIAEGSAAAGRVPGACELVVPVFIGIDDDERARDRLAGAIRAQIAFYGSTRTYRNVFELHGWGDVPDELHRLHSEGDLRAAAAIVPDGAVDAFAVVSDWDHATEALATRYGGVTRRLLPYPLPASGPVAQPGTAAHWADLATSLARRR